MLDLSFAVKQCVCCEGCLCSSLVESHYKSGSLINKQQLWMASQALVTELHGDLRTCYIFLSQASQIVLLLNLHFQLNLT